MDSSIIYRFFLVLFIFTTSQVNAIEFQGNFTQGHFILGKTDPKAQIKVNKKEVKVSDDGFFVYKHQLWISGVEAIRRIG